MLHLQPTKWSTYRGTGALSSHCQQCGVLAFGRLLKSRTTIYHYCLFIIRLKHSCTIVVDSDGKRHHREDEPFRWCWHSIVQGVPYISTTPKSSSVSAVSAVSRESNSPYEWAVIKPILLHTALYVYMFSECAESGVRLSYNSLVILWTTHPPAIQQEVFT